MRRYDRIYRAYGIYCNLIILICALSLPGYAKEPDTARGRITGFDDFGRKIVLDKAPERVVVISASPIDVIFELGAGDKIVGVPDNIARSYPHTCKRYPSLLEKAQVGGFSSPNIEKIVALNPDLIICYDSKDSPGKYSRVFKKMGLVYAVFTTAEGVDSGLEQIKRLGILLGKEKKAKELGNRLKLEIDEVVSKITPRIKNRPIVYLWWGSGNGTYGNRAVINELIKLAGGINLADEFDRQYMELSPEYVISRNPEVIVISYWQEKDRELRMAEIKKRPGFSQVKAVKDNRVYTIDGHSFHTPLLFAEVVRNLARFIHPELDGGK
ncbi:MAG: ABC transporter substrate-binding protein [bacterium]|nr:ABC transporter substrate-binding protein [bacterium]